MVYTVDNYLGFDPLTIAFLAYGAYKVGKAGYENYQAGKSLKEISTAVYEEKTRQQQAAIEEYFGKPASQTPEKKEQPKIIQIAAVSTVALLSLALLIKQ
jgi:hypothetical protein